MSKPYSSCQIDQLEEECQRALRDHDHEALELLHDELAMRLSGPRIKRLLQLLADAQLPAPARVPAQVPAPEPPSPAAAPEREGRPEPASGRVAVHPGVPAPPRAQRAPRLAFTPTPEQEQAVAAFSTGQPLKINAYAGTGKTSTLQLLAHSTKRKGQYLAFNRQIVTDSRGKFPPEVHSATTHSLAYRALTPRYPAAKLNGKIGPNHLVELLDLKPWRIDRQRVLAPRSQAFLIQSTVRRFCQSAAPELLPEHVPLPGSLASASDQTVEEAAKLALNGARRLWARMAASGDAAPLGHDGYLKVWALSGPQLPVDYILLDEAQDTNPVVLGVLAQQQAQIVYVGDRFQQIYEWRGAVNAMEQAHAVHQSDLTVSFRFGPQIAWAANQVLQMLHPGKALTGNPERHGHIGYAQGATVLARTNAAAISAIIDALDRRSKPHLAGGPAELIAMLNGAADLKAGQPSSVPEFFGFESWKELVAFARDGEGEDLLTFVNLVEARGEKQLLWALNQVADESQCDFVVSTAHKAKGREWDNVRLMDDFLKCLPKKEQRGEPSPEAEPSELRLLYVALTRARRALEVPPDIMEFLHTGELHTPPPAPRAPGRPPRRSSAKRRT